MTSQDQSVVQLLKKQVWTVGSCVKQQVDQPFLKVANHLLQYCNKIVLFKHETAINPQIHLCDKTIVSYLCVVHRFRDTRPLLLPLH